MFLIKSKKKKNQSERILKFILTNFEIVDWKKSFKPKMVMVCLQISLTVKII